MEYCPALCSSAGHIHIQIFICFEFTQHIIDGNFNSTVFLIDNLCGKPKLVNEKIKLFLFLFRHKGFHLFAERDRISELIVTPLVQFDFYDVVCLNSLRKKILIKQIKRQYRLSATADAGDYLDFTVPHVMNHTVQIRISFNHYSHFVLATNASLLSCIVCRKIFKLSIAMRKAYDKAYDKVATFASQVRCENQGDS